VKGLKWYGIVVRMEEDRLPKRIYSVSHNSAAIRTLVNFQSTEKYKEGKIATNYVFSSQVLEFFLPRMSPCGATLFTLSVVRSYGDVATLT
jgi:hypothetical protein